MRYTYLVIGVMLTVSGLKAQICGTEEVQAPGIYDTYHEYYDQPSKWNGFNVHDPTVNKDGNWYYMYNTDVGMGYDPGSGALKRRSQDLIHWEFLGQAFDGIPDSARSFFLQYNPDYTDNGIWAPFLLKCRDEYRLYYSAPGGLEGENLGFIGWATSDSAGGPWAEQGGIASSTPGDTINAIDPTVVIDRENGQHWMAYGSYQNGIYIVELDSATGGLKVPGDRGTRIAGRTGGRHAAIEGAEINYRNGWYYLFVSYDWLENYYNVRVGRSENPNGPYYDINGTDMAEYSNNYPLILKPYQFNDHIGWQGTGHCSVYNDDGQYYIFNQARPSTSIYNMVLHTRKIFWIDGWPVVSPERYAAVPQCSVVEESLIGEWELMELDYVPGMLLTRSTTVEFYSDGTIDGHPKDTWSLQDSLLTLSFDEGDVVFNTIISYGWDWEYECPANLFTGMNDAGMNVWGKKINHAARDKFTALVPGAVYTIRSHYSNMFIEMPAGNDEVGATVRQGRENGELYQAWRLVKYPDSDWSLVAAHSADNKVIEVPDGDPAATFLELGEFTGEDKQKFRIGYRGDGYFKILTKVSNYQKCFDLFNFSISEGGFISQWDDLNGQNQAWRYTPVDSLAIDNSLSVPGFIEVAIRAYPNPFSVYLHIEAPEGTRIQHLELLNPAAQKIYEWTAGFDGDISIEIPGGIHGSVFFLKVITRNGISYQKVIRQ